MSEFTRKERDVARELGVSRLVVESIRKSHLKMHKHWRLEANTVMLSEKGVSIVFKQLGISKKNGGAPGADGASAGDLPLEGAVMWAAGDGGLAGHSVEKKARVVRKFVNPKIIEGEVPDGSLIRIRVSDSTNFMVGMEVPVRSTGDVSGIWECTRRAPRFPGGRW